MTSVSSAHEDDLASLGPDIVIWMWYKAAGLHFGSIKKHGRVGGHPCFFFGKILRLATRSNGQNALSRTAYSTRNTWYAYGVSVSSGPAMDSPVRTSVRVASA